MQTTCLLLALVPSLAVLRATERADTQAAMMPRTEDYTLFWRAEGPPYSLGSDTRPATETLCFHGCTFVHVPPKTKQDFIFQMVYARYGGAFAASHAQLCLIGWGHNQFWDEAAIGRFGENICFEPGRIQRRCFIDNVRPLTTLPDGKPAKPWGWADNCGGGDSLMWQDAQGEYRSMRAARTNYRAYGPCLTDVSYSEETSGGELAASMDVSLPRSDDYLRAFLHLRYDVHRPIEWRRLAFFQLGSDFYNGVPSRRVAIGDAGGMREEWTPKRAHDVYDRRSVGLTGPQPWLSIHGLDRKALQAGDAAASRGLVVRAWRAVLGGKPAPQPQASFLSIMVRNERI